MANNKQRLSRSNPKVVRLSDPYDVASSAPFETIAGGGAAAKASYKPLKVLGSIKEKGFQVDAPLARISDPQPRVTPFPVARHRSEGPYWTPVSTANLDSQEVEYKEDNVAGTVAVLAQPLWRKSKPGLQLGSQWVHQKLSERKATATEIEFGKPTPMEGIVEVVPEQLDQTETLNSKRESECMRYSPLAEDVENTSTASLPESIIEGQIVSFSKPIPCPSLEGQAKFDVINRHCFVSKQSTQQNISEVGTVEDLVDAERHCFVSKQLTQENISEVETVEDLIDAENVGHIQEMSKTEITEAQAELMRRLRPEVVDMLKRQGATKDVARRKRDQQQKSKVIVDKDVVNGRLGSLQKPKTVMVAMNSGNGDLSKPDPISTEDTLSVTLSKQTPLGIGSNVRKSWTERVESVRFTKFNLDGTIVSSEQFPQLLNEKSPNEKPDIYPNVLERDFLRSEGDPASEGYSIKEAITLARSTVPGQRAAALRLIAFILDKAQMGLLEKTRSIYESAEFGSEDVNDWQAIWAYALGPEPQLGMTLRLALDDSHATVLAACAKALQSLLCCSSNQYYFHLMETFWPEGNLLATAPVFRKHTNLEEGFIGGGHWKYNVKPSNLYRPQGKSCQVVVQEEGGSTVGDDAAVLSQDVAAGLIRMGILPRIRYIIEVEQLLVVDEPLLHVLIALARHSPQAAASIFKCPRLLEAIMQRFCLHNVKGHPVNVKAIQLLKVLAQASRATCIHFEKSGVLQVAMSDLFKPGLSAGQQGGDTCCTGLAGTCEALQFWRVCVKYGIGISLFSDLYPALCFWLSPPSHREYFPYENDDIFCLARESYLLLGDLARTLPMLHANDQMSKDNDDATNFLHSSWSWSMAVPLIETSFGWLSPDFTSILEELGSVANGHSTVPKISISQSFVGALHAVLNFLCIVSGRVAAGKDLEKSEAMKGSCMAQSFWLPTFIPQLGLHLTAGNLLGFWKEIPSGMHSKTCSNSKSTLTDYFLALRKEGDPETVLALASCLHSLICLSHKIDVLLELAKPKNLKMLDEMELPLPQVTLHSGILLAAENELQELLSVVGDEISGNQLLQASEWNGRGGPAPGVGLGWGSKHGGGWSIQAVKAQKYALLTKDLLEYLPTSKELYKDRFLDALPSSNIEARLKWEFIAGVSAVLLADPGKANMLEELLSDILLSPESFRSIIACCHVILKIWAKNRESEDSPNIRPDGAPHVEFNMEEDRDILLQHFKLIWLHKKNKSKKEDAACLTSYGAKTWDLDTIPEESSGPEVDSLIGRDVLRGQMVEWAGSRLPLPNHWLLSPISTNQTRNEIQSIPTESLIRAGLLFLVGVEALMDQLQGDILSNFLHIPIVWKIHALSTLFLFGGDAFLQDAIRKLISVFQDICGFQLDEALIRCRGADDPKMKGESRPGYIKARMQNMTAAELYNISERGESTEMNPHYLVPKSGAGSRILDFELIDTSYMNFAEGLTETFAASSFGDMKFGCQVALYLRREVSESIRVAVWKVLANAKALELLPPLKHCIGHPFGYLYPPEDSENILDIYISAWTSGTLERAAGCNSLPFSLVLHHVAAFLFKGVDNAYLLRKKYVRNLVRASARSSKQQIMLLQLLAYGLSIDTSSCELPFLSPPALEFQDVEHRWLLLFEACAGDQSLLAEVQNLQNALPMTK